MRPAFKPWMLVTTAGMTAGLSLDFDFAFRATSSQRWTMATLTALPVMHVSFATPHRGESRLCLQPALALIGGAGFRHEI